MVALSGGACGAILFFTSSEVMQKVPKLQATFVITLLSNVIYAVAMFFSSNATFSMDPKHGMFGWARTDQLWYTVVIGLFSGFFGSAGPLLSLYFVSPEIMCSLLLLEPIAA